MSEEIKFVCEKDSEHDVIDHEKSNDNWKVYLNECPECGGEVVIPL